MRYVISYDISDDGKRAKLVNILKDYGDRVQKSVFECRIERKLFKRMLESIESILEKKEQDSIRIYKLCHECEAKTIVYGTDSSVSDQKLYIV